MSAVDTLVGTSASKGSAIDALLKPPAAIPKPAVATTKAAPTNTPSIHPDTASNIFLDTLKAFPEQLARGIGLGAVLDLPAAIRGYTSDSNAHLSLKDIGTGLLETGKGLVQAATNVIASPAVGIVEKATGQNVGTVKTPFGSFESPQNAVDKLVNSGYSRGEAIASEIGSQAASGGMLIGAGELVSPHSPTLDTAKPTIEKTVNSQPLSQSQQIAVTLADEARKYKSAAEFDGAIRNKIDPIIRLAGNEINDIKIIGSTARGKITPNDTDILVSLKNERSPTDSSNIHDRKEFNEVIENEIKDLFPNKVHVTVANFDPTRGIGISLADFYNKVMAENPKVSQPAPVPSGDVKLMSGIDPGLTELYKEDIKPGVSALGKAGKEVANAVTPQSASPEATQTADMVRRANATLANAKSLESVTNKPIEQSFEKAGESANIKNIGDYERNGKFSFEPTVGYSDFYRKTTDAAHAILREVYKDPFGYIDNYVRRQFEYGSKADEQAATNYFQEQAAKFSTDKSPTIHRELDIPLDQALREMKSSGIDVKPITTNPETLRQWTVANAQHAQVFEGLKQLLNETQDPNVARILENATSNGLQKSSVYQTIRSLNNSINQMELGLSAFHATGTAINAGISDLALGLRKIGTGDIFGGLKSVGRSLVPSASFIRGISKGGKFFKDLAAGNELAAKVLEEKINPGGARIKTDSVYTNAAWQKMKASFANGNLIGGTLRIPSAIIEKISGPLMTQAIPRVKVSVYLDMVNDIDRRMPNATPEVLARQYAKSWDSVDNRFGQLTYDNLFWNKTARDLSQVATRSVGWNLGTVREIGGGLTDILRGKISDRALYSITLPLYVGTIGAVYQYLHTGKGPQSLTDYFYPQNGLITKYGQADRVSLPTYMKDIFSYAKNPIGTIEHKASPLLSMAASLANNQDYFGDMIRNPADPVGKQLQQMGKYVAGEYLPFSIQTLQKQQNAGTAQKTESFLGFTKAPAGIIDPTYVPKPGAPKTPEDKATAALVTKAKEEIPQGIMDAFNKLKSSGYFNTGSRAKTASKARYFIIDAKQSPAVREKSYQDYLKRKATQ